MRQLLLQIMKPALDAIDRDLDAFKAADPKCLVQRVLLSVSGDLHAVWEEGQVQQLLLRLPLLRSDQLGVPSGASVLYTTQQYVTQLMRTEKAVAKAGLAGLLRLQQLSAFALSGLVH